MEELKSVISQEIKNLKNGILDGRIKNFVNYDTKYAILKPKVIVHIELTKGIAADVDISDFFEEELK